MKAQLSIEFLIGYAIMLVLISLLLSSLVLVLSSSKSFGAKISQKTEVESFARSLDALETCFHANFQNPGGFVLAGNGTQMSVELEYISGQESRSAVAYTIYGLGESHAEPA